MQTVCCMCWLPAQIVGAIFGALMVSGLMPNTHIGMGDGAPGELGALACSTRSLSCSEAAVILCCLHAHDFLNPRRPL
jgi:hypothetical protein